MAFPRVLLVLLLYFSFSLNLPAQETLRVGVSHAPPYCMSDDGQQWSGMALRLWRQVAEETTTPYELVPVAHQDSLLDRLERGELDVVLLASMSPDKEARVDFLQAFHHTSLGVALPKTNSLWETIRGLFTLQFLYIVLGLSALLFIVGVIVYFLERNSNDDQFGGERSTWQGIGSGFWWAGVTMTTIGYGDKAPRSLPGRAVAMLWMLVALAVTSSLTAAVITAAQSPRFGQFPEALEAKQTGVVAESPADHYLRAAGQSPRTFDTPRKGLQALQHKELDAFVADLTTLRYLVDESRGLSANVEATDSEPEAYAFAVREGSQLREPLEQAVIRITLTRMWREIKNTYDATRNNPHDSRRQ
ncbi:ABC-type amino acid transport substrate-binding protein [Lewinella marina]|uniref:Solute-binding protein family 3/N-terminal domain-containing protein n=1 Tax=Neolewinella marina TaxID=438751 RepID=A0A2G0CIG4_9BACT|nr:transporter substrate-binding domain-containing protein [Neolewinella marina]NJB85087.1 ABC-type amino acid transport substrate-binding protein [Neolewinella marina]PHK99773.1 hypothetical protein CGL56_01610 [Neolewinella marina]